ncbi:MAG: FAD-binding oxidoreductase [Flavobacteriales bacterium]|nr:FAD-binding oxidoreductase [Flavobacteriales bacterium]
MSTMDLRRPVGSEENRYDLHGGVPFWLVRNGIEPPHAPLDADVKADVAVVGGGITGALCAHHLSEAGIECVVLDARGAGLGSTCASTALLQYEIDTPLHELTQLVGTTHAVRSYRACWDAIDELQAIAKRVGHRGLERRPSVQYASRHRHVEDLRKEALLRSVHGMMTTFEQGSGCRAWLPFDVPAALRTEQAAEMDAWRFTHDLQRFDRERGVRIFERTPVLSVEENSVGVLLRTKGGYSVRAKQCILATGYEAHGTLPKDVVRLHSTYAFASGPGTSKQPWPERALIWETARPYLYLRTTPDERLIVGGRDVPFRAPAMRDALLDRKCEALLKDVRRLMPELDLDREFSWCGTFGSTKDGLPYIDRASKRSRIWFALGMGGNGIAFSVVAAGIIRDTMLGVRNPSSSLFRFDR